MSESVATSVTCELCGSVFRESRRRHYCDHCKKYFHVCSECQDRGAKCRFCGIPTKRKSEPLKTGK